MLFLLVLQFYITICNKQTSIIGKYNLGTTLRRNKFFNSTVCADASGTNSNHNTSCLQRVAQCRFSYAEIWELLDLFVRTKIFSYHICYENESSTDVPYNLVLLFNVSPGFFLWNVGKTCAMLARNLQQPVIVKTLTNSK